MKKGPIKIRLFMGIRFEEEENIDIDGLDSEPKIKSEGYYYYGHQFELNDYVDLKKLPNATFSVGAVDFDSSMIQNKKYVNAKLIELNELEIKKAEKEINYWKQEQKKLPTPIPKVHRIIQFYSTTIFYLNDWLAQNDESKHTKEKEKPHKKNYLKESKIYVNCWKAYYPQEITLEKLYKFSKKQNNPISISTWCRRLKDKIFLYEVYKLVNQKIETIEKSDKKIGSKLYEKIKEDLEIRITQVTKKRNKDLLDTSKIDRSKDVNQIEDINQKDEKLNSREASPSYITPYNKLILK